MILKLIEFLHKTFGVSTDTLANILVTIFTFSAGILITIIFKAVAGYLERRNHRKLLKINLTNLIKGIYRQANSYEKLSKQIDISHNGSFNFTPYSISAMSVFRQLGYRNLYNSCFNGLENIRFLKRNRKQVAFNNIWATLEFLNLFHKKSFDEVEEFLKLNMELNEERNKALGKVQPIVEKIRLSLHGELIEKSLGDYFNTIEDILLEFREKDNYTNPKTTNEFFIEPLLLLNRNSVDVVKKNDSILNSVELNRMLLESSLRYINQKNLMESYNIHFKELNKSFMSNFGKMKDSYRILCQ